MSPPIHPLQHPHPHNLLAVSRVLLGNIDGSEVSDAVVLPVVCPGEVVAVVDEEGSVVDEDRLADTEIFWREKLFHLGIQ